MSFGEAAGGIVDEEELGTAEKFFGWLVKDMSGRSKPFVRYGYAYARTRMMQWLHLNDPLNIAKDSECGYGPLTGF
jgi:hypothetical protein